MFSRFLHFRWMNSRKSHNSPKKQKISESSTAPWPIYVDCNAPRAKIGQQQWIPSDKTALLPKWRARWNAINEPTPNLKIYHIRDNKELPRRYSSLHTVHSQRLAPLWFVQDKVTPNYVPKSDAKEETSLSLTSKKFNFFCSFDHRCRFIWRTQDFFVRIVEP